MQAPVFCPHAASHAHPTMSLCELCTRITSAAFRLRGGRKRVGLGLGRLYRANCCTDYAVLLVRPGVRVRRMLLIFHLSRWRSRSRWYLVSYESLLQCGVAAAVALIHKDAYLPRQRPGA